MHDLNYSIYIIENLNNDKIYIGWTSQDPKRRWTQHKSAARTGSDSVVSRAIRKHGEERFVFNVFYQTFDREHSLEVEKMLISDKKSIETGYNVAEGGLGPTGLGGWEHTEEWKEAASERMRGERNPNFGKHHSEESRRNLSEKFSGKNSPRYGKSHTEEARKKISQSRIGKPPAWLDSPNRDEIIKKQIESCRRKNKMYDPFVMGFIVNLKDQGLSAAKIGKFLGIIAEEKTASSIESFLKRVKRDRLYESKPE